nr:hypothetical protein CFP56_36244 [Quercus suber]
MRCTWPRLRNVPFDPEALERHRLLSSATTSFRETSAFAGEGQRRYVSAFARRSACRSSAEMYVRSPPYVSSAQRRRIRNNDDLHALFDRGEIADGSMQQRSGGSSIYTAH